MLVSYFHVIEGLGRVISWRITDIRYAANDGKG